MNSPSVNLSELLVWYADAGVDAPMLDQPVDRFAEFAASKKNAVSEKSVVANRTVTPVHEPVSTVNADTKRTIPNGDAIDAAINCAAKADTLEGLREAMLGFEGCNLKFSARSTVFSDGNPEARVMIVGEGPDGEEDATGKPFLGTSGQLLDKMLAAIGLDRTSVYLSSIVPWRPPGNRKPTPPETAICLPFIKRHIELVQPEILLLVGNTPSQALLSTTENITRLRGKWQQVIIDETTLPAMPCFHPAYLLRQPAQKKFAWRDLLALSKKLDETADEPTNTNKT